MPDTEYKTLIVIDAALLVNLLAGLNGEQRRLLFSACYARFCLLCGRDLASFMGRRCPCEYQEDARRADAMGYELLGGVQ